MSVLLIGILFSSFVWIIGCRNKSKIIRVHAKKAGREAEVYLHSSLTSAVGGGERSASRFGNVASEEIFFPAW